MSCSCCSKCFHLCYSCLNLTEALHLLPKYTSWSISEAETPSVFPVWIMFSFIPQWLILNSILNSTSRIPFRSKKKKMNFFVLIKIPPGLFPLFTVCKTYHPPPQILNAQWQICSEKLNFNSGCYFCSDLGLLMNTHHLAVWAKALSPEHVSKELRLTWKFA